MSTSQFDFNIFFILFGVGRIDLGIFSSDELVEVIIGECLWIGEGESHIVVELTSEIIAITYTEDAIVYFYIGA